MKLYSTVSDAQSEGQQEKDLTNITLVYIIQTMKNWTPVEIRTPRNQLGLT